MFYAIWRVARSTREEIELLGKSGEFHKDAGDSGGFECWVRQRGRRDVSEHVRHQGGSRLF